MPLVGYLPKTLRHIYNCPFSKNWRIKVTQFLSWKRPRPSQFPTNRANAITASKALERTMFRKTNAHLTPNDPSRTVVYISRDKAPPSLVMRATAVALDGRVLLVRAASRHAESGKTYTGVHFPTGRKSVHRTYPSPSTPTMRHSSVRVQFRASLS